MPNAGNLWDQLRQFQALMREVQQRAPNPRDRQAMGELLEQVKTSQEQSERDLPKLLDHLTEQAHSIKAKAEAAQEQLAQSIKKAESLEKQAAQRDQLLKLPKKPARPPVAIDPHLGKKLQTELLGKLDLLAGRQAAVDVEQREAWQDWKGFESKRGEDSGAVPPPAAPKSAPPPAKAEPARPPEPIAPPPAAPAPQPSGSDDDDAWKGLSRMDQSGNPPSRRARDTKHPGTRPPAEKPKEAAGSEPPKTPAPQPEHRPAPPAPRPKPKPRKSEADDDDDDAWKGLSRLDD